MPRTPTTIDEYLAGVSAGQRAALQRLRETIHKAAPNAEECISYSLPAFRLNGVLVGFGASSNHCSFYPMSGTTIAAHKKDLEGFETSRGAIRFRPDKPLPTRLVQKLVRARLAENATRTGRKTTGGRRNAVGGALAVRRRHALDGALRVRTATDI